MDLFSILAVLLCLAAAFSYVNHRFIGLPTTIALMAMGLVLSLVLVGLRQLGAPLDEPVERMLEEVKFDQALLQGMLSYLLFAGALHVNLDDLLEHRAVVATLATVGVVVSTALVGLAMYFCLGWLGLGLPFGYCLLFGALISPTDPIAVLAILKSAGAPKALTTKITGESLFNDGIGVVAFVLLLQLATGGEDVSAGSVVWLFVREVGGGVLLGLGCGFLGYWLLKAVDAPQVEVLVTFALVTGGYALAMALHISGPLAVVIAGVFIGNHGRRFSMSDRTRERLDTIWEFTDEILNAVLFVLIGLEVLLVDLSPKLLLAGAVAVVVALLARLISVGTPITVFSRFRTFPPGTVRLLVWGGLRGGISVALALSIPRGPEREALVTITYCVVVFSILVQGLTIKGVARRVSAADS